MPELPEVETTRRLLAPVMEGQHITTVEVGRPRMLRRQPHPPDFTGRLLGRRVERLGRRGKFMLGEVEGDFTLIIHLGMSGRMSLVEVGEPRVKHTNVVLGFGPTEVRMVDPRTFGFVACLTPEEAEAGPISKLGPDALDDLPGTPALGEALAGRSAPIKALLLDQRIIAGLGNIYADEVLFRAGLHPRRPGGSLEPDEVGDLREAIGPVLSDGLAHGGTSLDDLAYLLPDGRAGEFTSKLLVYGREGQPCRRCGTVVERVNVAQRSSHFCPVCQPRLLR